MQEIGFEDKRKISLKILLDIDKYCRQNNITYFLACGTLLGAVKYKGFIPWDDDIDIMMPRPDYNRFLENYNGKYKLLKPSEGIYYYAKAYDQNTVKIEEGYDYNNREISGIDIDIFPLDGIVDDEEEINKLRKRSKVLETLLRLANQPIFYRKNPLKSINRIIPRIIGRKNLVKLIERNAQTYKYEDSEYIIRLRNTPNGFTGALKKDKYIEPTELEFEGNLFLVPNKYDEWLKRFYGENYINELPPIEKQKPHHKNKCYYK